MMEVVVITKVLRRAKLQSNRHHQQTNIQLFTGRIPFLSPNQQFHRTEGKYEKQYNPKAVRESRVLFNK